MIINKKILYYGNFLAEKIVLFMRLSLSEKDESQPNGK